MVKPNDMFWMLHQALSVFLHLIHNSAGYESVLYYNS